MNFKKFAVLSGFIILITVTTLIAFAEEPAAAAAEQQAAPKSENETQWAWGEVTNLDAQAKTFTLKYLDYETDQEKDIVLAVDEKTAFENIKNFDEIKINDTLSVDYMVGFDGKNIAKNINFEKPDSSPADPAQDIKPVEMTPAAVAAPQPTAQSAEAASGSAAPANDAAAPETGQAQ